MNYETIIIAVITSVPPTILAAAAFFQARETHKAVNSRMTELLELAKKQSADQATLAEKEAEHIRKGEAATATVAAAASIAPTTPGI